MMELAFILTVPTVVMAITNVVISHGWGYEAGFTFMHALEGGTGSLIGLGIDYLFIFAYVSILANTNFQKLSYFIAGLSFLFGLEAFDLVNDIIVLLPHLRG